ncbi:MAG TPA: FecR family protein [Syntrophales bacterium]|nr:FecR family protein [Syntrophales bacterium]
MKKNIIILCILSFVLFDLQQVEAKKAMELVIGKGEAKVNLMEGLAAVLPAGKIAWRSLTVGGTVKGGDEVNTGSNARLELILPDYSIARFAGNSRFKVLQIETGGELVPGNIKFHLVVGKTWANIRRAMGKGSQFELQCENAVAGVRGTVYRMNVEDDRSVLVRVYDGVVHVSGVGPAVERPKMISPPKKISGPKPIPGPEKITMREWVYIIKSMQQIRITADGTAETPRTFSEKEDTDVWVDWNKSRDQEL